MNERFLVCLALIILNMFFLISALEAVPVNDFTVMLSAGGVGVCGVCAYKNRT